MALTKAKLEELIGEVYFVGYYGAIGDGITDDRAAIQAAIDAAENGDTIQFEPKTYLIKDRLVINKSLAIDLNGATILAEIATGTAFGSYTTYEAFFLSSDHVTIKNGTIDLNYIGSDGVVSSGNDDLHFTDLLVKNMRVDVSGKSYRIHDASFVWFTNPKIENNWNNESTENDGIWMGGGILCIRVSHLWINNIYSHHNGSGVNIYQCKHVRINGVEMKDINDNGFYIQDTVGDPPADPDAAATMEDIKLSNILIDGVVEGVVFTPYKHYPTNGLVPPVQISNIEVRNASNNAFSLRRGSGLQVSNLVAVNCNRVMAGGGYDGCSDIMFSGVLVVGKASGSGIGILDLSKQTRLTIRDLTILGPYGSTTQGVRVIDCDDCLFDTVKIVGDGVNLKRGFYFTNSTNCMVRNPDITGFSTIKYYRATSTGISIENDRNGNQYDYLLDGVTFMSRLADGTVAVKLPTSSTNVMSGGLWNNGGTLAIK